MLVRSKVSRAAWPSRGIRESPPNEVHCRNYNAAREAEASVEAAARLERIATERGAARWVAPLVLSLGVLASLVLTLGVRRAQETALQRDVDAAAETVRALALERLDRPVVALESRIERWAALEPRPAQDWVADAEHFLSEHPDFAALVRVEPEGASAVAARGDGLRALRELRGEPPRSLGGAGSVGPKRLADGGIALGLELPYEVGTPGSAIFALLDPARLLASNLGAVAPRAALVLESQGVVAVELGERADGDAARELELDPKLGPAWTLRVWPSADAAAQALGRRPAAVLGAGLAISLLLAALIWLAQLAAARGRALLALERTLEQRLAGPTRSEAELRDAVLELETFVYSVSHDLRSPLGAIVNFAAILGEDYGDRLDAAGRDHLMRITRSAQGAVAMMNALLAFSRSGRQEMHKSWVDVDALARSVVAELVLTCPAAKSVRIVPPLPAVFADPSMLRLVLQNLLSNALKFSSDRADPRIEISGRLDARECEFSVSDDGIGFDMRHAPKLFRVFERLHSAEEFPGNGVGLAIAARIVRRHGGRISAEGAPGRGAIFRFALPRS